jgi:hypothetical protein
LSKPRFYLDENMDPEIARQLVRKGIDAVSVRDLGFLGRDDAWHLQHATELGCVLCTHDVDFIVLATQVSEDAGIAWSSHNGSSLGGWVRALSELYANETAESMTNTFHYLSAK